MNKIIEIEKCADCPHFRIFRKTRGNCSLHPDIKPIPNNLTIPKWCPLAELPENRIRHFIWKYHNLTHSDCLYGDDGEMQCCKCIPDGFWDFKRTPINEILDKLEKANFIKVRNLLMGDK